MVNMPFTQIYNKEDGAKGVSEGVIVHIPLQTQAQIISLPKETVA